MDIERSPATGADQLWRVHAADLMRFATVLVGPVDAHDITVEAFLRASPVVDGGTVTNPRAYLMRAVASSRPRSHTSSKGTHMTADLDHAVRSSLGDIIATAPKPDDQPMRLVMVGGETRVRRPYLAVAASVVVLAGVGALVTLGTNDANTDSPAAAPLATDDASAPEPVATAQIGRAHV